MTTGQTRPLRIATRGSRLALTQTRWVADRLRELLHNRAIEIVPIVTHGDARRDLPLTQLGEGIFVKALETELLEGRADLAVHSLKDVPSRETAGLTIASVPTREDPRDALIAARGQRLQDLADGATLATGSPRRIAQLRAARPDLQFTGVRGNVETRLRRLDDGEFDGLIMAVAGLARLGLEHRISHTFEPELCVPAVGQGALAVQCRADDDESLQIAANIDDATAHLEVTVERAILAALGGGCQVPLGALARTRGEDLELDAVVADSTGAELVRWRERGKATEAARMAARASESLGREAAHLLAAGRASS